METRESLTTIINIVALILSGLILLTRIFDLQYSLLLGPFIDVLLLMGLTILGLLFSIVLISLNGSKKWDSYIPFGLIVTAFCLTFLIPQLNFGHYLHYYTNKKNLEELDQLSQEARVFEMTDMLRYHKSLNDKVVSNYRSYTTKADIEKAFGSYIVDQNLRIEQICQIRDKLEDLSIISLQRTDDYLILTIDGYIDNEYGYVKTFSDELKVGETIPPFGFVIVRLIEFGDGWYFFYTT